MLIFIIDNFCAIDISETVWYNFLEFYRKMRYLTSICKEYTAVNAYTSIWILLH